MKLDTTAPVYLDRERRVRTQATNTYSYINNTPRDIKVVESDGRVLIIPPQRASDNTGMFIIVQHNTWDPIIDRYAQTSEDMANVLTGLKYKLQANNRGGVIKVSINLTDIEDTHTLYVSSANICLSVQDTPQRHPNNITGLVDILNEISGHECNVMFILQTGKSTHSEHMYIKLSGTPIRVLVQYVSDLGDNDDVVISIVQGGKSKSILTGTFEQVYETEEEAKGGENFHNMLSEGVFPNADLIGYEPSAEDLKAHKEEYEKLLKRVLDDAQKTIATDISDLKDSVMKEYEQMESYMEGKVSSNGKALSSAIGLASKVIV
jgi:hypothetical protein